jgi:tryptophanyl-tRNA synthetase
MGRLRHAVGLRDLRAQANTQKIKTAKLAKPVFKQYREKDGKFYFKLVDAEGTLLLQSLGFDSPKEAGQTIALLQTQGAEALAGLAHQLAKNSEPETLKLHAALAFMSEQE